MEQHQRQGCPKPPSSHHGNSQDVLVTSNEHVPLPAYADLYSPEVHHVVPHVIQYPSSPTVPPLHPISPQEPEQLHSDHPRKDSPTTNPTMIINAEWVESVAGACGDTLDSVIAETMTYETVRRSAAISNEYIKKEKGMWQSFGRLFCCTLFPFFNLLTFNCT